MSGRSGRECRYLDSVPTPSRAKIYTVSRDEPENSLKRNSKTTGKLVARVLAGNFKITDNSVLVNLCCDQFERRRITRDSQLHHFVYNTVLHLNARVQEIYTERIFLTFLIRSLDRNPDRPHGFRIRATAQLKSDSSVLGTSQKSAQFLLIFDDPPVLRAQLAGYLRKPVRGRLQSFPIGATFLLQRSDSLFKRCEPLYRSWIGERRLRAHKGRRVGEKRLRCDLVFGETRASDLLGGK